MHACWASGHDNSMIRHQKIPWTFPGCILENLIYITNCDSQCSRYCGVHATSLWPGTCKCYCTTMVSEHFIAYYSSVSNLFVIYAYDIVSATPTLLYGNRAANTLHGYASKAADQAMSEALCTAFISALHVSDVISSYWVSP